MSEKKEIDISFFLDDTGKIKQVPAPERKKLPLLAYLAGKFGEGKTYTEKEVNQMINEWHTFGDYFLLRRLLVDHKFLQRTPNGAQYWVVKQVENEEGDTEWIEKEN